MVRNNIHACVVFTADPHMSEYVPEHWHLREWLSGFTGSAATLVITQDQACLWTDSRYWEQASAQLNNTVYQLMQHGMSGVPDPQRWALSMLQSGQNVWADASTMSMQAHSIWISCLSEHGINLVTEPDITNAIWKNRPGLPQNHIYVHEKPFACRSVSENLQSIRNEMTNNKCQWHVMSSLDDIAWTFNLRGSDVSYNPVFLSYAVISHTDAWLFVDSVKLNSSVNSYLRNEGIRVKAYSQINEFLSNIPIGNTILYDPSRTSLALFNSINHLEKIPCINPSQLIKAQKNNHEISNIRATMEYDGVALCEFFSWLESELSDGSRTITELTIDEEITNARARQPNFVSPSFSTIAGFNANGAMPHYQATPENHSVITGNGLLLIDSGGQYLGGTTDITRVVPIGNISDQQRTDYTLVLKGMIALSMARFPKGTKGASLDSIARMPLWQHGLDYGHGTGHGVGYFMNVHEGPQSISPRQQVGDQYQFKSGMVTSNEPGLYRPDKWGIRIENLVLAKPVEQDNTFLEFETLTLCPIDTRCINKNMLSYEEIKWLNSYHDQTKSRLAPLLSGRAYDWLLKRTAHI